MEERLETVYERARNPAVAVIGAGQASSEIRRTAQRVGRLLAAAGITVVTGGGGGIMEAACQGAAQAGGITVGILPGSDARESPPNRFVQVPIYTGMGDARNAIVVRSAGAVVAIGGGFGTLSEIGLALKCGRPVICLKTWTFTPPSPIPEMDALLHLANDPPEAVRLAVALASGANPADPKPAASTESCEAEAPAHHEHRTRGDADAPRIG